MSPKNFHQKIFTKKTPRWSRLAPSPHLYILKTWWRLVLQLAVPQLAVSQLAVSQLAVQSNAELNRIPCWPESAYGIIMWSTWKSVVQNDIVRLPCAGRQYINIEILTWDGNIQNAVLSKGVVQNDIVKISMCRRQDINM